MIAPARIDRRYGKRFTPESFLEKSKRVASVAGRDVLEKAHAMYFAMTDRDTPVWAKTVIAAALGYFVMPLDAIVDMAPVAGYADDLGMIVLALGTVATHVKTEHWDKAKVQVAKWLGEKDEDASP